MSRESAFPKFWPQAKTIPESPWPLALGMAVLFGGFLWGLSGGTTPYGGGGFLALGAWATALADHLARYWPDVRRGYVPANPMWMTEKNTLHHFGVFFLAGTLILLVELGPLHVQSVLLGRIANWTLLTSGLLSVVDWVMLIPTALWWLARRGVALASHLAHRGSR